MRIRFRTWRHRPPHRVTVRLVTVKRPYPEYAGLYRDSRWVFDVPDDTAGDFRLALDGQAETAEIPAAAVVDLDEDDPHVSFGDRKQLIPVDDGRLQQLWFAQGTTADELWDIVVVGTGFGGGTLTAELATRHLAGLTSRKALTLEAGSMLFPTHVGNLPPVRHGKKNNDIKTSMWSTLYTLGSRPVTNPDWEGREVFALGGRSLYWGGLCPRVHPKELEHWPKAVREDLIGPAANWYVKAEDVLGVGNPRASQLARDGLALLDAVLPDRDNRLAPVALRSEKPTSWRIPGGLFSTAEQLLELRLSREYGDDKKDLVTYDVPYVHLAELVLRVEEAGDTWLVHGVDLRDGSRTLRRAKNVVLSAGTVESARILAASRLDGLPREPGKGLTEHPMAYVHFEIPATSPYYDPDSSTKLLSVPAPDGDGAWNMILELGSDLDLTQRDPVAWSGTTTRPGAVAGQLVFLGSSEPKDGRVEFDATTPWPSLNLPESDGLPAATLRPSTVSWDRWGEWTATKDRILDLLGARPLPDLPQNLDLRKAGTGFVAHEIGTLPMSGNDDKSGMVNPDLQVWGKKGLYVCDNSVFPTSPAANPSLTLAALALRLAEHLCA